MADYGEYTVRIFAPEKLREAREAAGKTLWEVGGAVGRSDDAISGYERGITPPQTDVLLGIAEFLGVDITEFFPVDENKSGAARAMFGGKDSLTYRPDSTPTGLRDQR